jgi:hypothetical protein
VVAKRIVATTMQDEKTMRNKTMAKKIATITMQDKKTMKKP